MPELPELQAHAERLTSSHAGATLERFEPLSFTALKTFAPAPDRAVGHTLDGVTRRGKYLLLPFGGSGPDGDGGGGAGPVTFVVHLMQGGRLRVDDRRSRRPRGGIARWFFADAPAVLLTEAGTERRAGIWVLEGTVGAPGGRSREGEEEPLAGLGPDADVVDRSELAGLLDARSMRLHGFLRDQHLLAGLGRRLANEICHRAQLSPFAVTGKLDEGGVDRLAEAVSAVLADELAAERAHDHMRAAGERDTAVHGRTGEPCPVCGDVVRSVEFRDYTIEYCPTCQTDGRILADNAYSRLGVAREDQPPRGLHGG